MAIPTNESPPLPSSPPPPRSTPHLAPVNPAIFAAMAKSATVVAPREALLASGGSAPRPNRDPVLPWCPVALQPLLPTWASHQPQHEYAGCRTVADGWRLVAATRRGLNHARRGVYSEDAFASTQHEAFVVACVSDGAGSHRYSRVGAALLCEECCTRCERALSAAADHILAGPVASWDVLIKPLIGQALLGAIDALRALAAAAGAPPEDFRCTLLLTVLWQPASPTARLYTTQVGDGFIAIYTAAGQAQRLGETGAAQLTDEVSCFVPDPCSRGRVTDIRAQPASAVHALLLCTDGIEAPFYPTDKTAGGIFAELIAGVHHTREGFARQEPHGTITGAPAPFAAELLSKWLAFEKPGEHDDRTVLLLQRDPLPPTSSAAAAPEPPAPLLPPPAPAPPELPDD